MPYSIKMVGKITLKHCFHTLECMSPQKVTRTISYFTVLKPFFKIFDNLTTLFSDINLAKLKN